jgi:hypothetical protein
MNNEYRAKFKQILEIKILGPSLKGDLLEISLKGGFKFRIYGNTNVRIFTEFGEQEELSASKLKIGQNLFYETFI